MRVPGPTRTATATKTLVVEDPSYVWSTTTVTATVTKQAARQQHTAAATHARPAPPTDGFTYKISADSGSATNVTYMKDGDIVQDTGVSLPWSKTVDACGTLCIVSAQNAGSGKITCEIDGPDGVEDKSASTGAYAVVNCQA